MLKSSCTQNCVFLLLLYIGMFWPSLFRMMHVQSCAEWPQTRLLKRGKFLCAHLEYLFICEQRYDHNCFGSQLLFNMIGNCGFANWQCIKDKLYVLPLKIELNRLIKPYHTHIVQKTRFMCPKISVSVGIKINSQYQQHLQNYIQTTEFLLTMRKEK